MFGEFSVESGSGVGEVGFDVKYGTPIGRDADPVAGLVSELRRPPVEVSDCIERNPRCDSWSTSL
jgi:hypothetical protein